MSASFDPPPDDEPGAVVDPGVLEQRRARRDSPVTRPEPGRVPVSSPPGERRAAELESEVARLTRELDRRVAESTAVAAQVARLHAALSAVRVRAEAEERHQAASAKVMAGLRAGQQALGRALEALRAEHADASARLHAEVGRRQALERLVAEERASFAAEVARAQAAAGAERDGLLLRLGAAEQAVASLTTELDGAREAFRRRLADERGRARADEAARRRRDAAVERLVGEIGGVVDVLRAGVTPSDAAVTGEEREPRPSADVRLPPGDHPALTGARRPAAPGEPPRVIGDLDRAAARLRALPPEPAEAVEPAAEPAAGGEDPPEALEAVEDRGGAPGGSATEEPASAAARPGAEPAGATAAPGPEEPTGAGAAPLEDPAVAGPAPASADAEVSPAPPSAEHLTGVPATPAPAPGVAIELWPPAVSSHALAVAHAAARAGRDRWFGPALSALARRDPASAERMVLAALAVQGARAQQEVEYEVMVPATGLHRVTVRRDGTVLLSAQKPTRRVRAAFRVSGSAVALLPLVEGGLSWRLAGVRVRGRRRVLQRLLLSLEPGVGLAELAAAGARPRPQDLLGLLCSRVAGDRIAATRLRVAYLVADGPGPPARVVVQAADGAVAPVTGEPADSGVDATVTVEQHTLLEVLAGTAPASVAGERRAVATLHSWLRDVQGLPV